MLSILWQKTGLRSVPRLTCVPDGKTVSPEFRTELLAAAEAYRGFTWPPLPAVLYLDFDRTGNRARFETVYFQRRQALALLVLAEWLTGEGIYLDDIINGVWCICEESSWVLPAHHNSFYQDGVRRGLPKIDEQVIDLFAAETGALLAWTWALVGKTLEHAAPEVNERILLELKRRITEPYIRRDDFWWMGLRETHHSLANWVPWTTGNCLRVVLMTEPSEEQRWLALSKALTSLDKYLSLYSPDGGCDEGPSYWGRSGGSLFECLEMLWELTEGAFDPFSEALIQKMGQYMYKVHIAGSYFVNFADGSAKAEVDGPILFSYGKRIGDRELMILGAEMYRIQGLKGLLAPQTYSLGRILRAALLHKEIWGWRGNQAALPRDHWLEHLQVLTCREATQPPEGFFLAAKGGHNGESHNHNDVGSCIVFYGGKPLMIDVGVETYTAKTFSAQRYEIWTMQSGFHNLPIINGVEQAPGRDYRAGSVLCQRTPHSASVEFEIAGAYPKEAGVLRWRRFYELRRGQQPAVIIQDSYALARTHLLQFVFILAHQPELDRGDVRLYAGEVPLLMTSDLASLLPEVERIPISDARLRPVWGDCIYRLIFTLHQPPAAGQVRFAITPAVD
ncbi:MAG: heparinase II/III domain-containing protein [Limnochordia bacterium]|jgi:hypothetical protein